MKRLFDETLRAWAAAKERKPLLVRGARQVGKTYSVRKLAGGFRHFIEINFDETSEAKGLFDGALTAKTLATKLSGWSQTPIVPGETLLFLDELQTCPNAIRSLRYFYEQMPGLHVVGAGSLLEFVLEELPSFGVGRISSRHLYPMTFREYLDAVGAGMLSELAEKADFDHPLDSALHGKLVGHLRDYMLVGGMPAAVERFVKTGSFIEAGEVLDELVASYRDDFAKYRKRVPVARLDAVLKSVAVQAGGKFVSARVGREEKSTCILDALALLVKAGLVHRVHASSANGQPLGAASNPSDFKAFVFDVGIQHRLTGLDFKTFLASSDDDLVNKGALAELVVANELVAASKSSAPAELFYWRREARNSNAEVDFVLPGAGSLVPVEVKANVRGAMQSLRAFLQAKNVARGVRTSLENFGRLPDAGIAPIYAVHRLLDGNLGELL